MQRDPAAPPELDGYTAVRVLGLGGFSDVFLYQQELPRRQVAVKVLSSALTDAVRSAFVREANLMAALSTHPYIVTIYQAGIAADGRAYLVMEYCSRPSLAERYKRQPLSVADTLRTGIRIAGAVATLHGAGILHRDIKPANVLTNDYGWPALTDFGIATSFATGRAGGPGGAAAGRAHAGPGSASNAAEAAAGMGADGGGTGMGAARGAGDGTGMGADRMGTTDGAPDGTGAAGATGMGADGMGTDDAGTIGLSVPWSPPEMFVDVPSPDVRSDVFSLAATLYTVLAGRTPFEIRGGPNGQLDLIARIERGEVTPMVRTDVPVSLLAALARGMAPRREDRWSSALELARALQRVELELGYAPTGIELPGADIAATRPDPGGEDEGADENATRLRAMPTVIAQPPATLAAPPAAPPRLPARGLSSEQAIPSSPATSPGPATSSGRAAPSRRDAAPGHATGHRSRIVGLVVGILAIGAIAAVVVAILIAGLPHEAASGPGTSPTGGSAVGPRLPSPVKGVAAVSADGTSVTFTWTNPSPKKGDVYYWARSESPDDRRVTPHARVVVTGVVPGSRVCIDVALGRSGRNSAPERICTRP